MLKNFFKYFFVTFLFLGCSVKPVPVSKSELQRLTYVFDRLGKTTRLESLLLAKDIVKQTQKLTKEFKLTSPPLWHNFLVNIGIKDQGLCYHWSDALYLHLLKKEYEQFSFYLVGSNIGEYFFEHNALVVVKKDAVTINGGIIIDPWRESGKLYFSKVENDEGYQWKRRETRELFPSNK